jgi:hypothetical protein
MLPDPIQEKHISDAATRAKKTFVYFTVENSVILSFCYNGTSKEERGNNSGVSEEGLLSDPRDLPNIEAASSRDAAFEGQAHQRNGHPAI